MLDISLLETIFCEAKNLIRLFLRDGKPAITAFENTNVIFFMKLCQPELKCLVVLHFIYDELVLQASLRSG